QQQQLIHHTFVGAKTNRVSKKSCYRTELAPVRTAAPRLHRDDAERSPAGANFLQHGFEKLWNDIELFQVDGVPGDWRGGLQGRLMFLAKGVDRSVDVFQRASGGVVNNSGPGFVRFAESYGVGVARPASS